MPPKYQDASLQLGAETLEAKAEAEKAGIVLPSRPVLDLPKLPSNLTELGDDELMELMVRTTRWLDHLGALLALREIDERYAESAYDLVWATRLADAVAAAAGRSRSEASVTVAKAEATQHADVKTAESRRNMAYANRKVMRMMYDNLDRSSFLLSRELTRRIGRHDREARVDRWRP